MSDSIRHEWQTLEQAAVTLQCSTRTIHRKISSGQLESRTDDAGRRQVLVTVVTPVADTLTDTSAAENPCQTADVGQGADTLAVSPAMADTSDSHAVTALVLATMRDTLEDARRDVVQVRRRARVASLAAAVMAVAVGVGVVAAVRQSDQQRAERDRVQRDQQQLVQQLEQVRQDRQSIAQDRDQLRDQLEDARIAAAVAQTQADVVLTRMTPATQPSTRPVSGSLLTRLASIFSE